MPEGPKPAINRPLNYVRIVTTTTVLLGIVSFFSVAYPYILPIIQNRNLWAGLSLITILLFTSGHMFNHIRKVPYVAGDGKGGISYFAGGFSNQFGMETQIVAAMCMSISEVLSLVEILITHCRWRPVLRNNCPCAQGPAHGRPKKAADSCVHLVRRYAWHVQLPSERFQDQKRGLSFSSTAFLRNSCAKVVVTRPE